MRMLFLITGTLIMFVCNSTNAQQARSALARNVPATSTTSLTAYPRTIPTVGARPASALGTINTGASGQLSGSTIGAITTCATIGVVAVPSTPFNASFADPLTGALSPQPLPGATLPPAYSFGSSTMTGACNPTASATAIIEALGTGVAVTLPGLAITTAPTYGDATVPATGLEVDVGGMSPQIVVPTPVTPSASPCVGNATIPLTVVTDPTSLATSIGASVAGTSTLASTFGC